MRRHNHRTKPRREMHSRIEQVKGPDKVRLLDLHTKPYMHIVKTKYMHGEAQQSLVHSPVHSPVHGPRSRFSSIPVFYRSRGRSTITGLDQWTGLVDWTGGLIKTVCKLVPMHEF